MYSLAKVTGNLKSKCNETMVSQEPSCAGSAGSETLPRESKVESDLRLSLRGKGPTLDRLLRTDSETLSVV